MAESPSRLDRLRVLRDKLTGLLDEGSVPVPLVPQYVGQLTKVLAEIEACEKAAPATKGTALDEVAARRAAKGSGRSAVR